MSKTKRIIAIIAAMTMMLTVFGSTSLLVYAAENPVANAEITYLNRDFGAGDDLTGLALTGSPEVINGKAVVEAGERIMCDLDILGWIKTGKVVVDYSFDVPVGKNFPVLIGRSGDYQSYQFAGFLWTTPDNGVKVSQNFNNQWDYLYDATTNAFLNFENGVTYNIRMVLDFDEHTSTTYVDYTGNGTYHVLRNSASGTDSVAMNDNGLQYIYFNSADGQQINLSKLAIYKPVADWIPEIGGISTPKENPKNAEIVYTNKVFNYFGEDFSGWTTTNVSIANGVATLPTGAQMVYTTPSCLTEGIYALDYTLQVPSDKKAGSGYLLRVANADYTAFTSMLYSQDYSSQMSQDNNSWQYNFLQYNNSNLTFTSGNTYNMRAVINLATDEITTYYDPEGDGTYVGLNNSLTNSLTVVNGTDVGISNIAFACGGEETQYNIAKVAFYKPVANWVPETGEISTPKENPKNAEVVYTNKVFNHYGEDLSGWSATNVSITDGVATLPTGAQMVYTTPSYLTEGIYALDYTLQVPSDKKAGSGYLLRVANADFSGFTSMLYSLDYSSQMSQDNNSWQYNFLQYNNSNLTFTSGNTYNMRAVINLATDEITTYYDPEGDGTYVGLNNSLTNSLTVVNGTDVGISNIAFACGGEETQYNIAKVAFYKPVANWDPTTGDLESPVTSIYKDEFKNGINNEGTAPAGWTGNITFTNNGFVNLSSDDSWSNFTQVVKSFDTVINSGVVAIDYKFSIPAGYNIGNDARLPNLLTANGFSLASVVVSNENENGFTLNGQASNLIPQSGKLYDIRMVNDFDNNHSSLYIDSHDGRGYVCYVENAAFSETAAPEAYAMKALQYIVSDPNVDGSGITGNVFAQISSLDIYSVKTVDFTAYKSIKFNDVTAGGNVTATYTNLIGGEAPALVLAVYNANNALVCMKVSSVASGVLPQITATADLSDIADVRGYEVKAFLLENISNLAPLSLVYQR